ncbi:hypothetical protein L2719_17490 [Shewanella schlegeliana]|uniref:Uncharacterized protein n=1 Tax=Shewanella schlegeliana TaxID=190308 RepID=A0ABS1SU78_9GAMM|nr:hypothetical protein [Shewanella schlegeliana]MBL4912075.1 hypothetical protein [Shewanella schlegeliana]MCL1111327.1 hypothetical protein [Shewanella schlegeliana]GIU33033.1 hypothetical protein TUM4433_26810 [Shewanella schlegeliana]
MQPNGTKPEVSIKNKAFLANDTVFGFSPTPTRKWEIGIFTVHIDGDDAIEDQNHEKHSYAGYFSRSKSSHTIESGVRSGMGVLDSQISNIDV